MTGREAGRVVVVPDLQSGWQRENSAVQTEVLGEKREISGEENSGI